MAVPISSALPAFVQWEEVGVQTSLFLSMMLNNLTTFIHTLLDDCFPCNVGDWEHGIKYVTEDD